VTNCHVGRKTKRACKLCFQQPLLLLLLLLERRQKEIMNTSESKVQAFVTSKRLFLFLAFELLPSRNSRPLAGQ